MPIYNGEKYLDAALASLSSQTFPDLRIIISDNASTDTTPDIIASWMARDSRITSHRQRENIGALANFEWVLHAAQSPWFMFAAYDDTWSENYVEALYQAAIGSPAVKLAAPTVVRMDSNGKKAKNRNPFFDSIGAASGLKHIKLLVRHAHSGWYYGLFDRKALIAAWEKSQSFQYTWGSDYFLLLPILLSGEVTGNNEAIFYQRITERTQASYSPNTLASQKELFFAFLHESLDILRGFPFSAIERARLYPALLRYADRHAWRVRRLIRDSIKEFFFAPRLSRKNNDLS